MNAIDRAGIVLIRFIWVQGRLVDLIIFKQHPKCIHFFNKNWKKGSPTLGKERRKLWKLSFSNILKIFLQEYSNELTGTNWPDLLNDIAVKRDAIGHSYVSLGRNAIFYTPSNKRNLSHLKSQVGKIKQKTPTFKIPFDDKNYENMINAVVELDVKLFPRLSNLIGLDYYKIR